MTPEQIEKLEEQAYARIIWGEGKKEVVQSLLGEGVPREEAERIVKESLKDRAAEIRKEGFRNVLWGTLLFAGAALGFYCDLKYPSFNRGKAWGVFCVLIVFGLFFLVKGGFRLLLGKESGSISGMD